MKAEPTPGLYRLLAWLSPSFPVGAFSYSHGLEAAVADGTVHDRATLSGWIAAILAHGGGRIDADLLRDAHRAACNGDATALAAVNRRGAAYRATAELALESAQQGAAFLATCRAAWPAAYPHPDPPPPAGEGDGNLARPPPQAGEGTQENPPPQAGEGRVGVLGHGCDRGGARHSVACHSVAFGAAAGGAGIALGDALLGYLGALAGNLVSAGLRLGVIGQTDGQRILAALEPVVGRAAAAAMARDPSDFGAASFAADLASMAHETQYSRLFRS